MEDGPKSADIFTLDNTKREITEVHFFYDYDPDTVIVAVQNDNSTVQIEQKEDIANLQRKCPDFEDIYAYLNDGTLPENNKLARKVNIESQQYSLLNGILYHWYQRRTKKPDEQARQHQQLALPRVLRNDALLAYHDSQSGGAHLVTKRVYEALKLEYYWPKMHQQVNDYVRSCDRCQRIKTRNQNHKAPLTLMPIADSFERWHIDILELTQTKDGDRMSPATESTEYSPYYLLFGKKMNLPFDIDAQPKDNMGKEAKEHIQENNDEENDDHQPNADNAQTVNNEIDKEIVDETMNNHGRCQPFGQKNTTKTSQILDLPNNIAITPNHRHFTTFNYETLYNCDFDGYITCDVSLPFQTIKTSSCIFALLHDNKSVIFEQWNFRVLPELTKPNIFELPPAPILLTNAKEVTLKCPNKTSTLPGCQFCIQNIPCSCSLQTSTITYHPRLVNCQEKLQGSTRLYPINLALLHAFFGFDKVKSYFGNTYFKTAINISIPNFEFYNHKFNSILASDNKDLLDLKKIAKSAKKDEVIFQKLTESLLDGQITLDSNWPDTNGYLGVASITIGGISFLGFVYMFL
ncbi:unnamed protein product [Mytilus coruscus]|uniref:Integrase zinc-binding domain-containing protein n=1 Tax=Mytilus coruscus TaxID=42192 RepID=A0A6J8A5D0_MYTCO|nr:unnamed protein product [Mytilus coruscus]